MIRGLRALLPIALTSAVGCSLFLQIDDSKIPPDPSSDAALDGDSSEAASDTPLDADSATTDTSPDTTMNIDSATTDAAPDTLLDSLVDSMADAVDDTSIDDTSTDALEDGG